MLLDDITEVLVRADHHHDTELIDKYLNSYRVVSDSYICIKHRRFRRSNCCHHRQPQRRLQGAAHPTH